MNKETAKLALAKQRALIWDDARILRLRCQREEGERDQREKGEGDFFKKKQHDASLLDCVWLALSRSRC